MPDEPNNAPTTPSETPSAPHTPAPDAPTSLAAHIYADIHAAVLQLPSL